MNVKRLSILGALCPPAAAALLAGCAATAIDDSRIGLRRASVFEVVEPVPFVFDGKLQPAAPLPGSGMPPMIAHAVDDDLPITAGRNECRECHDKPALIGRPVASGKAKSAPASHYRGMPPARELAGSHYNCIGCHAPQADVPPLVSSASG